MDMNLFKDIKLGRYLLKIVGINVLGLIIAIIGGKFFLGKEEYISFLISIGNVLVTVRELKKNKIAARKVFARSESNICFIEAPMALILTYVATGGVILILTYIVIKLFPQFYQSLLKLLSDEGQFLTKSIMLNIFAFVEIVLIAPIFEEILFRGILFTRFKSKYGVTKAIVFSSLIFFALHITLNPSPLIVGITNCILVLRYRSLIPGIAIHMLNNAYVFIMEFVITPNISSSTSPLSMDIGNVIIGVIMIGIYIAYICIVYPREKKKNPPVELSQ